MSFRSIALISSFLIASSALFGADLGAVDPDAAPNEPGSFRGQIILAGKRAGETNGGVFAIKPDGTGLTTIGKLENDTYVMDPRVSPQGNQVAVGIGAKDKPTNVWLFDRNGSKKNLVENAMPVAWSSDGQRLACYRQEKSSFDSFAIDIRTKAQEKLPLDQSSMLQDWSPDNQLLCAVAMHEDKRFEHPTKGSYPLREVFLVGASGKPRTQLRSDPLHDDLWGRFSPNGTQVTFQRRRHEDGMVLHEVVVQGRDGKDGRKVLSFEELKGTWMGFKPQGPACWSPDGKQLVTLVIREYIPSGREPTKKVYQISSELLFVTLETGAVRRLDLKELGLEIAVAMDWR